MTQIQNRSPEILLELSISDTRPSCIQCNERLLSDAGQIVRRQAMPRIVPRISHLVRQAFHEFEKRSLNRFCVVLPHSRQPLQQYQHVLAPAGSQNDAAGNLGLLFTTVQDCLFEALLEFINSVKDDFLRFGP